MQTFRFVMVNRNLSEDRFAAKIMEFQRLLKFPDNDRNSDRMNAIAETLRSRGTDEISA